VITIAALLDVPARDQLARIRLIVQTPSGDYRTSGTTANRAVEAREVDELEQRGLLLRWSEKPIRLGRYQNPAGFWMGAEVSQQNQALRPEQQFPVPSGFTKVTSAPWEGIVWFAEAEQIHRQREAWVKVLAWFATREQGDERSQLFSLMLSTMPRHELTRGVLLFGMEDEAQRRDKLKKLLRAEGRTLPEGELIAECERLVQAAQSLGQRPRPSLQDQCALLSGDPRPARRPSFDRAA
jgi:hypothetical protein